MRRSAGDEARLLATVLQAFEEAGASWEPVLDHVCRLGAELTGDPWVIRLVDEHGSQHLGGCGSLDPQFDEDLRALVREVDPAYTSSLVAAVLRDAKPVLLTPDVLAAARDSAAPEHIALAAKHGITGGALVPMRVRGTTIGSLWVACTTHDGDHDEDDLRFFADVADRCALALDNARLLRELQAERAQHLALLAHVSDAVCVTSDDGTIVWASPGVPRQLGWEVEELIGTNVFDVVHRRDHEYALQGFLDVMGVDERPPIVVRVRSKDGSWRHMEINADNLLDNEHVRGVVITAHDVTDLMLNERLVNAENDVLEKVATGAPLSAVFEDVCRMVSGNVRGGACTVWLLDDDADELIGACVPAVSDSSVLTQGHTGAQWCRELPTDRIWVSTPERDPEFWRANEDVVREFGIACSWTRPIHDRDGAVHGALIVFRGDVRFPDDQESRAIDLAARLAGVAVHRARDAERLAYAATHEPVTGLPNRSLFHDRLRAAVSRQYKGDRGPAVLFIDLDRFKQVNDRAGHAVGDDVLCTLGERLQASVRPGDLVARFGGDEFGVLCEAATEEDAVGVAERVLAAIQRPVELPGWTASVSASIGVAVGRRGVSADQLVRRADMAMYRAKGSGAGRIVRYRAGMNDGGRAELEQDLRVALDAGAITLHYQPIIDLQLGRWIGVEGLARWWHEGRGWVPPNMFVPLAEEVGLIGALGDRVLDLGLRQGVAWRADGIGGVNVGVNVSGLQLNQPGFADRVAAALTGSGFPARRLVLELTETVMMDDFDVARSAAGKLHALGVHLGIDDFGTGHSSLARLRQFPASGIKLDRTFVHELGQDSASEDVVAAVVQLAHAVRMAVIAEGVETMEQLLALRRLGVDAAQGYLLAHPMPAEDCAIVLRHPSEVMADAGLPTMPTRATPVDRVASD